MPNFQIRMEDKIAINTSKRTKKWILAVMLVVSVLSGYSGNSHSSEPRANHTELVFLNSARKSSRTIQFRNALQFKYCFLSESSDNKSWLYLQLVFDELTSIRESHLLMLTYSFISTPAILCRKVISQKSDDYSLLLPIA